MTRRLTPAERLVAVIAAALVAALLLLDLASRPRVAAEDAEYRAVMGQR